MKRLLPMLLCILLIAPGVAAFEEAGSLPVVDRYRILEGTELENEITVITGAEDGPTVFIVGGIHGNEVAGIEAGKRLKAETSIVAGKLYIIAPANQSGAAAKKRYVDGAGDLNRAFPGDPEGDNAQRIAAAIFGEIERLRPELVIDLHEANHDLGTNDGYGLGNSIIYTNFDDVGDLLFSFLLDNEAGNVGISKYSLVEPGVAGSVNRTVSRLLGIPIFTIETLTSYPLEQRVADQLAIVHYALRFYGLE